jgi:AraC family transcriptional regulator
MSAPAGSDSGQVRVLAPGEFVGAIVKSVNVADAYLTIVRHDEARTVALHEHECAYFCLLVHGRYTEFYEGRTIEYKPFQIAIHPPRLRHSDEIGEEGSVFFMIELAEPWNARLGDILDLKSVKVELGGHDLTWLAMRIFRELSEFTPESELHVESLLFELIAAAGRVPPGPSDGDAAWFRSVVDHLNAEFSEDVSMAMLADIGGVHPVTVARAFRTHYHQTASEFINRLRVRLACEKILGGDTSLAAIAADCGFSDQSYFTRVFKGVTGTTPAAFRETMAGTIG